MQQSFEYSSPQSRVDQSSMPIHFRFLELLKEHPITLIPTSQVVHARDIVELSSDAQQKIIVCDIPVSDLEVPMLRPYGISAGRIINIDHHADLPEMRRYISSGNLAMEYVDRHGPCLNGELVIVNHKDCDSILSSLIVRGILPPEERYGKAVIAADHRGEEDPIADLLQALQYWGNDKVSPTERFAFSVRNLELLLSERTLDPDAAQLVEQRKINRAEAARLVSTGQFTKIGRVAYTIADSPLDAELFLPYLPDSQLIAFAYPSPKDASKLCVRLRLGLNPPAGVSLLHIGLNEQLDPAFGGRWNAGSNRRGGGTSMPAEMYMEKLAALFEAHCVAVEGP